MAAFCADVVLVGLACVIASGAELVEMLWLAANDDSGAASNSWATVIDAEPDTAELNEAETNSLNDTEAIRASAMDPLIDPDTTCEPAAELDPEDRNDSSRAAEREPLSTAEFASDAAALNDPAAETLAATELDEATDAATDAEPPTETEELLEPESKALDAWESATELELDAKLELDDRNSEIEDASITDSPTLLVTDSAKAAERDSESEVEAALLASAEEEALVAELDARLLLVPSEADALSSADCNTEAAAEPLDAALSLSTDDALDTASLAEALNDADVAVSRSAQTSLLVESELFSEVAASAGSSL